LSEEEKMVEE